MTTYTHYNTILDPIMVVSSTQVYPSLKYRSYLVNTFYTVSTTPIIYAAVLTNSFWQYVYWKTYLIFKFHEFTKQIFRM